MDTKRYLIEILLQAREQVAQVAQRATNAIDNVSKAQDRLTGSSKKAGEASRQQVQALEQMRQARIREKRDLDASIDSLRRSADARRKDADAARKSLEELQKQARIERAIANEREKRDIEEVTRIRRQIAEREASTAERTKEYNAETSQLRKQAALVSAVANEEAAANRRRAAETDLQIASRAQGVRDAQRQASVASRAVTDQGQASRRATSDIRGLESEIKRLGGTTDNTSGRTGRLGGVLRRLGVDSGSARQGVRGLNSEFQGFQVALFIKYIQSIITAVVGLAGQLFAVGAAAAQAGAGIAGALAAGAAQAVPVIGVLGAALLRVKNVLQAVKLQNQQQLTATKDATTAARAQRTAAEQVASAQQAVGDAHRNTARAIQQAAQVTQDAQRQERQAQQDVTQARKDAIRTVEDLIDAEKRAQLSVEDAQAALRQAQQSGDIAGVAQAQLGLQEAQTGQRRARQDAAPVRARGVEGVDAVRQAEQRLADTRRQNARQEADAARSVADAQREEQRAGQNLNQVRRDSADNLAQETAATDKLKDSLARLSPAERELYSRIIRLQGVYRRATRPITDIIIRSFSGIVDHVISLLQDPRLQRAFRGLATQISSQINRALNFTDTRGNRSFIVTLINEARRNLPRLTHIFENVFTTVRNLILDALPAFRLLLRYVDDYTTKLNHWVGGHRNSLRDFFRDGIKYAKSFFDLGLAVANLFLAIAGPGGGASQGKKTIDGLTDTINGLTRKVRSHTGQVKKFFSDSASVLHDVISVIGSVAGALASAFNPESVHALADFLNNVIIPAFSSAVTILGTLVNGFHQLASLPGVSSVLQVAATMLILGKGLSVISEAVTSLTGILPALLVQFGLLDAEVAEGGFFAAIGALGAGGWIVLAILAIVAAVALLDRKFHFLGPTWKWIKGIAMDVFNALKHAGQSVLHWLSDVWTQGLLYWIRWPFMKLGQLVPWDAIGHAITSAFHTVLNFFTSKQRGAWGVLQDVLFAPFRFFGRYLGLILSAALLPVRVFLDILAGRFGDAFNAIKGFFSDLIDAIAGGFTTFLGIIASVVGALAHLPRALGGDIFKGAAGAIDHAKDSLDKWRESLRKHTSEQKKSNDATGDAAPKVKVLRNRYQDAKDQLRLLTPGTDAYKNAVKRARVAHQDLNDALKTTRNRARDANRPISTLGTNVAGLGAVAYDTAGNVKDDLNAILTKIGGNPIKVSLRTHRTAAQQITGSDNPLLGNPFAHAYGGYASPFGGSTADDHILLSPSGMPVAAMSGTEGIVNTPQMGAIDTSLALSKAMGVMPWGSLSELWGSGMRHYARGGFLQLPRDFSPTHQTAGLSGYPAVDVFASPGTRVGSPINGRVVKMSGRPPSAGAYEGLGGPFGYSEYISGGGRTYFLTHFGSTSVRLGQGVRRGQMIGTVGNYPDGVPDHIHEGLHGAAMRLVGSAVAATAAAVARIRMPRFSGLAGSGAIGEIATHGARRLVRAANAYLERQAARSSFPSGDSSSITASGTTRGNGANIFRQIARQRGWSFPDWWAIDARETSHGANLANSTSTARLRGQFLSSNWGKYGIGSDPRRNPTMKQQIEAMALYISQRYGNPTKAWAHERAYNWYARGGPLRRMQTGGAPRGMGIRQVGSFSPFTRRIHPLDPGIVRIIALMSDVHDALAAFTARRLRRVKDLGARIRTTFEKITGDGGVLDQMETAIEAITTRAQTRLQERQFRVGRRGPRRVFRSPAQLAQDQLTTLRTQRTGLTDEQTTIETSIAAAQRALHEAQRRHNHRVAAQARAAILNLRNRLDKNRADLAQNAQDQVEAQENFQSSLVDAVNNHAQAQMSHLDRLTRLAQLGGVTNFGAIGGDLRARQNVLLGQRAGLQNVLGQATRTGNVELATSLRDQIDELNTQLRENTQAIKDNTDEAFNARTTAIQNRASFATGILGSAQSFFQAIGQSLGIDTTGQQNTALRGVGSALSTAQGGLKAQLASLLGYSPQEASALRGLTGGDLVSYVASIVSGPAFDSIMRRLDPTQQQSFQDLLSALVDNATATQQNTDALTSLTGANDAQSFTSSFWSAFRVAVFNGAGGLLPQYQTTIPGADVGARVLASGALMVHAGENVRPASVARDLQGPAGGDTYNFEMTSPVERFDPVDAGRQLSFYRKVSGR